MANQMIALGVRGPQIPDLGAASARMSNMMANTAVAREKQAGIARANAFRQLVSSPEFNAANPEHIKAAQALDPEGAAQIAGAFDKRNIDRVKYVSDFFETSLMVLSKAQNPQQLEMAAGILDKNFPDFKEVVGRTVQDIMNDPSGFTAGRNKALFRAQKAAEQIPYLMPKAKAELGYGMKGEMQNVITGGAPGVAGVFPLEQFELRPTTQRRGEVDLEPSVTVEPGVGGPMERPPTTNAPQMMPGLVAVKSPARLAAATLAGVRDDPSYQAALSLIERNGNGDLATQIRRAMPTYDPAKANMVLQSARAAFESQEPQDTATEFPIAPGGVGGEYIPTGRQAMGKSPMQAPMPGIYSVSPGQVTTTSRAEKTGVEEATRLGDLKKGLPKAKGALGLATKQLARDIADIDYVLTNPYREMVLGQIEGAFPSATSFVNVFRSGGQDAQNVQARLNKINASSVVKHLQQMRDSSPQGSSLFGQVTEYEDRLVAALAGLQQSQDEPTFERALREYRNVLVEMYQNLPQVFNDTYGEIGAKETVPSVPKPPRNSPTISDVQYLRRNKNNPNVVNGFRKEFGENAYKMAIGGR